jgi:hypothetical protein
MVNQVGRKPTGLPVPVVIMHGLAKLRRSRLRPAAAFAAVSLVLVLGRPARVDPTARSAEAALCKALLTDGLACDASDVLFVGAPPSRFSFRWEDQALLRAKTPTEPADLYMVSVTRSPEGALLAYGTPLNVTRSNSVDEGRPLRSGPHVAYFAQDLDGLKTSVHTLDLRGRAPPDELTALQRLQLRISQAQNTGHAGGLGHDVYVLSPPAEQLRLSFASEGILNVEADTRRAAILLGSQEVQGDVPWLRGTPESSARPASLVPWAVDRVRGISWFGEEKMQWVKAIAFKGLELVQDLGSKGKKDRADTQIAEDMAGLGQQKTEQVQFSDPEVGWPPAPMKPVLSPPLPGEGAWIGLDGDPFITKGPGAPPAFVTSVIRTDPKRPFTRVYVTLWDPRQIALHMEAGTVEPVSATGEAGPGVIPRTPEVIKRVVAGFNGGFQAMHGEFGMQANGIMYLPPKPFGATVMELRDGSTAFGVWPKSPDVPDEIMSYRQNLTPLVQNGRFNIWGRTWWGGTPIGWPDNIHTTRSGVCLSKEGYVGYFYGQDIAPEALAQAMLAARCDLGVHLDMNPGLAGFEFYNVQPALSWKPLGRPLQGDWEQEGTFKELPEYRFRARRMVKSMTHMNFPQYVHRHGRDFFYLTARRILPGAELPGATAAAAPGTSGQWKTKGLPQYGFPYAVATSELTAGAVQLRALRIDPRAVGVPGAPALKSDAKTVVMFTSADAVTPTGKRGSVETARVQGNLGLFHARSVFLLATEVPEAAKTQGAGSAAALLRGVRPGAAGSETARAAVGIGDDDGMLTWLELGPGVRPSAETAKVLADTLSKAGCSSRMLITADVHPWLGGALDLAGERASALPPGPKLLRANAPGARRYFEDTPVVSPDVWLPLQAARVRYFRKLPPQGASSAQPKASQAPSPPQAPSANP